MSEVAKKQNACTEVSGIVCMHALTGKEGSVYKCPILVSHRQQVLSGAMLH